MSSDLGSKPPIPSIEPVPATYNFDSGAGTQDTPNRSTNIIGNLAD